MGTTYSVKIVSVDERTGSAELLKEVRTLIEERLDEVNRKMSTYREDSEISRLNRHAAESPFEVSPETLEVLRIAQQVSEETTGAFDITAAPLIDIWGFGPEGRVPRPPDAAELEKIRARIGYRQLEILPDGSAVRKARPDVRCDVSAVAKGYAVDRVAEALEARGLENYMVEVGGEVRTRGVNARGVAWRIGIEEPDPSSRSRLQIVPISGVSIATSGDYRNYHEVDGRRVTHIMDPRACRPIQHGLASITVIHERCALADAYATAIMVLGPDEGYRFATEKDLPASFMIRDSDGFSRKATPAFKRHLESQGSGN
jgi:thiamine biosynthesis lipoprotein